MTRIFIDGFESDSYELWDITNNVSVVSSAGLDMDGDYCINAMPSFCSLQKNIIASDEMYCAFLYKAYGVGLQQEIISFFNDSIRLLQVRKNIDNTAAIYRGATLLGEGTNFINIGNTCLIEVYLKIADSGGRFVVKINGIIDIDFTGDTKESTYTQFDKIWLGNSGIFGTFSYYDNFIIDDADWIGDTKIQAVVPTGAGNSTNWTASAGNNWECVDEIPANDADYVHTNTNDILDTYTTGDLIGTIESVKCVQVQARAKTDGTPTPTNLKMAVRSGGTDYVSGDNLVPSSEKSFSHIWEDNPADASPWEEADVNAMEIGVKSSA